ncbi:M23 family metallopeptidase [Bacillus haynesii]|uniref:M23 family metallopeptidase n=1 Tax=Bacillus haynesii TaxID=1925021 RepID=UPI0004B54122|nr:M23 family metallopeptidase [Bacillus haynesii]
MKKLRHQNFLFAIAWLSGLALFVTTPGAAAADGTVSKSYQSDSYGQVIFIKHDNGYETVYAHLSKRLKKEKERVKKRRANRNHRQYGNIDRNPPAF